MLTDDTIDHLSKYYGKAIRDNVGNTYEEMKKAVWASYWHLCSSDKKPGHQMCPKGADSWYFFNRALARKETPQSHKEELVFGQTPSREVNYNPRGVQGAHCTRLASEMSKSSDINTMDWKLAQPCH